VAAEGRVSGLVEELAQYQAYMRDVVPQYKKQLLALKQQLKQQLKKGAHTVATHTTAGTIIYIHTYIIHTHIY
jgi:hypothetical protein